MPAMETTRRLPPVLLALAACLLAFTLPAQGTKHPFLWKIEGPGVEKACWLYGTMHLGDDRLLAIPKVVDDAMANADALYCELAMDEMMKNQVKMTKMMLLPKGQKLSTILPADLYEKLDKRLRKLGASAGRFDNFQIWALNLTMAQFEAAKAGMLKSLDQTIYATAKSDGLEVGGLETFDEQMAAVSAASQADQIAGLRDSLAYMDKLEESGKTSMGILLEAYLTGSEHRILSVVEETMGPDEELNERLMKPMLEERNGRMADRIAKKLTGQGKPRSFFFAVGAMHNIGKGSVVELLRKKGYTLSRVAAPRPTDAEIKALQSEVRELRKQVRRLERRLQGAK